MRLLTTCAEKALSSAESPDTFLFGACEALIPRKRTGPQSWRPVYWWSEEIAELRRLTLALHRRYQACLRRAGQPDIQEARLKPYVKQRVDPGLTSALR